MRTWAVYKTAIRVTCAQNVFYSYFGFGATKLRGADWRQMPVLGQSMQMMAIDSTTSSSTTVWFLVGPFDSTETVRYVPLHSLPFTIGRRQDLALTLASPTVSGTHAEINEIDGKLLLRDLNSTNGTYVNGRRLCGETVLREDDLVQFANIAFRLRRQVADNDRQTVQENVCDRALALVQFDKLMSERAVVPFFQPIVNIRTETTMGYEVLGRSRLFGLENPLEMFRIAAQLNLEVELSRMLRCEGVLASAGFPDRPHLFINTHPQELVEPGLIDSLRTVREVNPDQQLTLEIHEAAVTDSRMMAELRAALRELNIGLAYDDFGAGQTRLNEVAEVPPDYLKFDISLVRSIDTASRQRQQMIATLVQMVRDLGIVALAEGIETASEADTCRQLNFELAQGYHFGRPAPVKNLKSS